MGNDIARPTAVMGGSRFWKKQENSIAVGYDSRSLQRRFAKNSKFFGLQSKSFWVLKFSVINAVQYAAYCNTAIVGHAQQWVRSLFPIENTIFILSMQMLLEKQHLALPSQRSVLEFAQQQLMPQALIAFPMLRLRPNVEQVPERLFPSLTTVNATSCCHKTLQNKTHKEYWKMRALQI